MFDGGNPLIALLREEMEGAGGARPIIPVTGQQPGLSP